MTNYFQNLLKKIKNKQINIAVFGIGYVGIKLVLALAEKNCNVTCYDQDKKKLKKISEGKSPFSYIPDSDIKKIKKKLFFENSYKNVVKADIIIMCLPTPLTNNKPDLSSIKKCWMSIKKFVKKGQLIILESTTYPGCTEEIFLNDLKKKFKIDNEFFLSYSPERENPGDPKFNFKNTPKVVSGINKNSLKLCNIFYKIITKKTVLSPSIKVAEMSKLLENIYRSINIALINELKIATHNLDINIYDVIKIASTKPFGFQKFLPGPGTGGHCIPIDPIYFSWYSKKMGFDVKFIKLSSQINSFRTSWIIKKILDLTKNFIKPKILLLGLSYKKNIEDTRESASIKIFEKFKERNFNIDFCDPYNKSFLFHIKKRKKIINSKKFSNGLLNKYNMIILATDHDKFNYNSIKKSKKLVIDLRGKYKNIISKYIHHL